jgi:hypothetical protein
MQLRFNSMTDFNIHLLLWCCSIDSLIQVGCKYWPQWKVKFHILIRSDSPLVALVPPLHKHYSLIVCYYHQVIRSEYLYLVLV